MAGIFFLISGYGLFYQLKNRANYLNGYLTKRCISILLPYIIMILIYWSIYRLSGIVDTGLISAFKTVLTDAPIVKYSWFVIVIIYFYAGFYVISKLFQSRKFRVGGVLILTLGEMVFYYIIGFSGQWYKSSICFFIGCAVALYEKELFRFFKKHYAVFVILCLGITALSYCAMEMVRDKSGYFLFEALLSQVLIVAFSFSVILLLTKVEFGNVITNFLSRISFEIYMVHGLFITLLRSEMFYIGNEMVYCCLVILFTIIAAFLLNRIFGKLKFLVKS